MAAHRGANVRHRAVGQVTVLSADSGAAWGLRKTRGIRPSRQSLERREPKAPGGLNRTLPANVPKFDQPHPETGFDRECMSSNPLTPATQSLNLR
jgi:hypothetical protein